MKKMVSTQVYFHTFNAAMTISILNISNKQELSSNIWCHYNITKGYFFLLQSFTYLNLKHIISNCIICIITNPLRPVKNKSLKALSTYHYSISLRAKHINRLRYLVI